LDGWRAIAIIAVLFCHGLDRHAHPFALQLGFAGVLLFFSISGFLITSRLLEEHALTGKVSFHKFYLRRAFRILPPALFFLGVITLLGLSGQIPFAPIDTLKALLFVRNYAFLDLSNAGSWYSVHFWSLAVEEHFYLIWPAILVLVGIKRARWVAPGLAVAAILWRSLDEKHQFVIRWFHAPFLTQNYGRTDYMADVLLWGCTLALWLSLRPWKSPLPRGTTSLVALVVAGFLGYELMGSEVSHGRDLVYLLMAALIGCTVTDPGSVIGRLLELAPLRFIGRLSYSLYLWQQLFFRGDRAPLAFQHFPLNVALIFACACFSYYLVERPMIRLGSRIARRATPNHTEEPVVLAAPSVIQA
jgi:peptidoglycan/LPS O-acetylase OafA/YrhL